MAKHETLIGGDLSHHNYGEVNPSHWSFVMLKATEGATYTDCAMSKYIADMAKSSTEGGFLPPFIGLYHFARPDRNTFHVEVQHYLKTIEPHIGNCLPALDWEDSALRIPQPEIWAIQFLREVKKQTGSTPLFYCSASELRNYPNIVKEFPIWVAHYHSQNKHDDCGKYAMWQITSNPFDIDVFNGGREEFASLIKGI